MSQPNQSKRSPSLRYATQETAHIEVYGQLGHTMGEMRNVSKTGALLKIPSASKTLALGDVVHVTVHLHSLRKTHFLHAEVVWNIGESFGIQFVRKDNLLEKVLSRTNGR
jgi:hypothetical protein